MSGMETAGRGFGIANRRSRTTARQQPSGHKWIKVSTPASLTKPVEFLAGPVPPDREKVERQFTTYCRLSLGHPRKSTPQKVDLLRQLFSFILEVDNMAAIQPYMTDDPVNSVCHPAHILDKTTDFEHYFPEVKYFHRHIRTQCRLSTSKPIQDIKQKIFDKLRANETITCHESARCGFFLYAHPDFTFRNDIINVLTPILHSQINTGIKLEFDVRPEKLNVAVGSIKLGERVVMLRSTPTHSDKVQQILTQLFTGDDTTDIQTLRKYIFVPLLIVGDEDRSTLQGVLRAQQLFRTNVYHYIITKIWNITQQFQLPVLSPHDEDVDMEAQNDEAQNEHNDNTEALAQDDTLSTQKESDTVESTTGATEAYSLREWFYDLTDVDKEPLIHAQFTPPLIRTKFLSCAKKQNQSRYAKFYIT